MHIMHTTYSPFVLYTGLPKVGYSGTTKEKEKQMATKFETFNRINANTTSVEQWNTRFGLSGRVVKRMANGRFVTNVSAKQMIKA